MTALLVLLILLVLFVAPIWPYNPGWGYTPVGTLVAIILIVLLLGAV